MFTYHRIDSCPVYDASVSKDKAWNKKDGGPGEYCPVTLANALSQPMNFYTILRRPSEDPPSEVWDVIRLKWPVLADCSNEELLEALKPIKA